MDRELEPLTEETDVIEEKEKQEKKKKNGRRAWVFLAGMICGMILCMVLRGGLYLIGNLSYLWRIQNTQASASGDYDSVVNSQTLKKMQTIEEAIQKYYYGDEVTNAELQEGVFRGMIASLNDPYSEYYSKEELEEVISGTEGISYGIGAYISINQTVNMPMISGVMEQSPALEAGLREGDIIYKVNGEDIQGYSLTKVVNLVKGKENTKVYLTIYREGEPDFLEIEAVRGKLIETETVQSAILEKTDHIGYLQIAEFDGVTVDQFNEAIAELRASDMKGLILDLRSNPGGDLTAVVDVARRILPEGMIVYTEDKEGQREEYTCDGEFELEVPLVVLVNEYSASASEILAGAIKDYNKGTLIGTTTYGKGIVQRISRLEDGTALKLTVSAYYTPSGENIHGIGIEPDIELEYDYELAEEQGIDNQLEKAIEVLEGKIKD